MSKYLLSFVIIVSMSLSAMEMAVGVNLGYSSPSSYFTGLVNDYNDDLFTRLDNPVDGETREGEKLHPFHMLGTGLELSLDVGILRIITGWSIESSFKKDGFYEVVNTLRTDRTEQMYSLLVMEVPLDLAFKVQKSSELLCYFGGGPVFVYSILKDNLNFTRDTVQQLQGSYEYTYKGGNIGFNLIFGAEKKLAKNPNLSINTYIKYRTAGFLGGFTGKRRLDETEDSVIYQPLSVSGFSMRTAFCFRFLNTKSGKKPAKTKERSKKDE